MAIVRTFPFSKAFSDEQINDLESMLQFILSQIGEQSEQSQVVEGDTIINNITQDTGPINDRSIGLTSPKEAKFTQLYLPYVYNEDITIQAGDALCIPDNSEIHGDITVNGQLNII